jgi:hypothetical protein
MIDPDGRDEWELDKKGYLKKVPNTVSDVDKIFPLNEDGIRIETKPFEIKKGILDKMQRHPDFEDPLSNDVHKLTLQDDKTAQELNEFLWNNTTVEFTLVNTTITNYITTSHEERVERGLGRAFNRGFIEGIIEKVTHNHPSNNPNPSQADKDAKARNILLKAFKGAIFQIYTEKEINNTHYHQY